MEAIVLRLYFLTLLLERVGMGYYSSPQPRKGQDLPFAQET